MSFNGMVLALDLATVTGFAFGRPGTVPKFAAIRFGKPGGARALAYRTFRTWLDSEMSERIKPDLIVFESPAVPMFMGGKTNIETVKLLIGLAEHLEEWSYNRLELREASVSQVRSHFIGSNMKASFAKPLTIERCRELGWAVGGNDEADACALWDYQCCFLRPDLAPQSTPLFQGRRR